MNGAIKTGGYVSPIIAENNTWRSCGTVSGFTSISLIAPSNNGLTQNQLLVGESTEYIPGSRGATSTVLMMTPRNHR